MPFNLKLIRFLLALIFLFLLIIEKKCQQLYPDTEGHYINQINGYLKREQELFNRARNYHKL